MGCGTSAAQVTESFYSVSSSKPLKIEQMFLTTKSTAQFNKIYLFGQTQTKRKILELSVDQKTEIVSLNRISQRYHIPRPKIQIDTLQMMYEEAQQVIPLNLYNSTTLPPFNQMYATALSDNVIFLCGGIDYQFWNICAESFLYKINSTNVQDQKTVKVKLQKPQTSFIPQKQTTRKYFFQQKRTFNKFQRLAFMNEPRYSHMGICIKHPLSNKNVIFVFGGFNSNKQALNSCQMYSFDKNIWQRIPDMNVPRATGFCFYYLDKIYVCGGFSRDEKRSKKIQVFDPAINKWNLLNIKLHHGIEQGFMTSLKPNQIIIMGGNTQGQTNKSVIRYNLVEQTYKWDSDMLESDSLQKGIKYYNKVFILGGNKPEICQIYDSKNNTWKQQKIFTSQEIKPEQLTLFSSLTKSLFVDFIPFSGRSKQSTQSKEDFTVFGTDFYPIIKSYHSKDLLFSQKAVSMELRLRKNMGILRISENNYFISGGIDSLQVNPTKATFNYNSSTGAVEQLDKMPIKKFKSSMIKHKNHIYSIGGSKTNLKRAQVQLKDCCRYNLLTKKWQKLPELNFRRSQCEIIEFQKGLIIFGGYSGGQWVQNVEYLCTENDKMLSFTALGEKVPLVFPFYSKLVSFNKDILRIYVLNRNIHTGNFQSIYFNINLSLVNKKSESKLISGQNKNYKTIQIDKLEQFDSIEVIINERVKTLERLQQSGVYKKKKTIIDDFQEKANEIVISKQKLQPTLQNVKKTDSKALISPNETNLGNIPQQQEIKYPSVNLIQVRSKTLPEQNEKTQRKSDRKSEGSEIQDERNQIEDEFADNQQQIQEMSMSIQKLSMGGMRENSKQAKNEIDQLKSPVLSQDVDNQGDDQKQEIQGMSARRIKLNRMKENMKKTTSEYNRTNKESINEDKNTYKTEQAQITNEFIEIELSQVIKGLQTIQNPNQWIKLKQKSIQNDRIVFVRNHEVFKCSFLCQNHQNQVQLSITKQNYENSSKLSAYNNNSYENDQKQIPAIRMTQNYS